VLRLGRAAQHNRLDPGDLGMLGELLARVEAERSLRALVLTASGRSFCAGYDLAALAAPPSEAPPAFDGLVDRLEDLRLPVIAALNGSVYGGAIDLALACDIRLGVPGMKLVMPAARIGIHYYYGGLRRYAERLGLGTAKRLLLAGEPMMAEELLRLGFLDRLVPPETLLAEALALAEAMAANAPVAVQGMKRALNAIARGEGDAEAVGRAWRASLASADLAEGLQAQRQKRPPVFRDPD